MDTRRPVQPAPERVRIIRWLVTALVIVSGAVAVQMMLRLTGDWCAGVGSAAAGIGALLSVPVLAVVVVLLVRAWLRRGTPHESEDLRRVMIAEIPLLLVFMASTVLMLLGL